MRERILKISREHQKELITNENNIVIGNYTRGSGKSWALALKVLYEKPEVCFYVSNIPLKLLMNNLKQIDLLTSVDKKFIEDIYMKNQALLVVEYSDGMKTFIWDYAKKNTDVNRGLRVPNVCDIAIFDEVLPVLNIQSRKYISCISTSGDLLRLYPSYLLQNTSVLTYSASNIIKDGLLTTKNLKSYKYMVSPHKFYNEFDILHEYENMDEKNNSMVQLIDEQIVSIMNDFKNTTNDKTMTKKDLLFMVQNLIKIKGEINESI